MNSPGQLTMWHPQPDTPQLTVTAPAHAWLAVAVAAAGGHHLSLTGAPGTGKTLLAKALHHLLPGLTATMARQQHRRALPSKQSPSLLAPPWQQPHHTCSVVALTGSLFRDGALGLAHQGVIFLNDAPEFPGRSLDAITTAIGRCESVIMQAGKTRRMPSCAQMVLASRPCPCMSQAQCGCSLAAARNYQRHTVRLRYLAGLDISLDTVPVTGCESYGLRSGPLGQVKDLVAQARRRSARRHIDLGPWVTSHADFTAVRHPDWAIPAEATARLRDMVQRAGISVTRSVAVTRVAWTLADLAARGRPSALDIDTALALHRHNV